MNTTLTERDRMLIALRAWIAQRPGLEYGNYGDVASYRAECRSIARDLREARTLLDYVEAHPEITADDLREAFRGAYSGRLSWVPAYEFTAPDANGNKGHMCSGGHLEYCTGQYWPTEYRRAACAVLASAIWEHFRTWTLANDPPRGFRVSCLDDDGREWGGRIVESRDVADKYASTIARSRSPAVWDLYGTRNERLGDYLRRQLRGRFGASLQKRWFN